MTAGKRVPASAAILFFLAGCGEGGRIAGESSRPPAISQPSLESAARAADVAAIQNAAGGAYRVERTAVGLRAANAAQGLRFDFSWEGVELAPSHGHADWKWRMTS